MSSYNVSKVAEHKWALNNVNILTKVLNSTIYFLHWPIKECLEWQPSVDFQFYFSNFQNIVRLVPETPSSGLSHRWWPVHRKWEKKPDINRDTFRSKLVNLFIHCYVRCSFHAVFILGFTLYFTYYFLWT